MIGGGNENKITSGANHSAIICGQRNDILAPKSFIGAGSDNTIGATATSSSILEGDSITATMPNRGYSQELETTIFAIKDLGSAASRIGQLMLVARAGSVGSINLSANNHIILRNVSSAGTPGAIFVSARANGTPGSFSITLTSGSDKSTVGYVIVQQI